ncbi:MAG: response regulator [Candidatus Brocadiae bacterium]|nr:response regulator [Candidatus Brocadiia bacterium]
MSRSMLVVDDEETIRWALRELFMQDGWRVHCAADGDEAGRLVEQNAYDFMITDLKMPGLSGVELIRKARDRNAGLGVMVLTGYASLETAVDALRLRAWDYVTKPCKVSYLKERVGAFVEDVERVGARSRGEPLRDRDLRDFMGGAGTHLLSFDAVLPDGRSQDALAELRRMFTHLGLAAERAADLVQLCVEAIALVADETGGASARASLLNGYVLVGISGPREVQLDRLTRISARLGVDARLVLADGTRGIVVSERI